MAIATLTIDMVAKLANLESDMGKAARIAEKNAAKMDKAFATVAKSLAAIGATLSVGAFAGMVRGVADAGDQLAKLSTRTGAAVEELSKLQYAASLSDTSNEELGNSLTRLNRLMGEAAQGSKEATDAIARFDIKPGTDVLTAFKQIADRVKATGDETKIASALNDVFGRSFQTLIPLLKGGSDGLRDAGDELERMGGVMTTDLAKASEEFNDNITRMYTQLNALKVEIIGPLIPLFLEVSNSLVDTADGADKVSRSGAALKTVFETMAVLGANVSYVFKGVGNDLGGMAAQINALAHGDFEGFSAIGDMMKEDAAKARAEIDALSDRLLNSAEIAKQKTQDISKLLSSGAGILDTPAGTPKAAKSSKAKKDDYTDPMTATAEAYAKAIERIDAAEIAAYKSTHDFNGAQSELFDLMSSPLWDSMPDTWRKVVIAQSEAASASIKVAESQAKLNALLDATPTAALEKTRADMELLAEAFKDGKISAEQFNEAATARLGLDDGLDEVNEKLQESKSISEELGLSFTSAFEDAIVGGKDFSDVLEGIEQDILRIMIRKTVTEPLTSAVSDSASGIGSFFSGLFANADGGVYNSPSLSAYSGGVYSSPKLFKFASGAGVFGEAGPEAIMPLKRGADGKLGVAGSSGGAVTVNVINNANGTQATQSTRQDAGGKTIIDVMIETVKSAIAQDIGSGGMVSGAMESQYGLNRSAGAWR